MAKEKKDLSKYLKAAGGDGALLSSSDSNVELFIDTGSYTLNAICSGSLYGGIPDGRVVLFYGESSVGKTLFLSKICGNAQRQHDKIPVIYDAEHAYDAQMGRSCGMNPDNCIVEPVISIEDFKNKIVGFLNEVIKNGDFGKFIIGIDSLAAPCEKELKDAAEGKVNADMGARSKAISALIRIISPLAAKAKCSIIMTNQVYDDPGALHKSAYLIPAGGKRQIFQSSIAVQLRITKEKYELDKSKKTSEDDEDENNNSMIGISKNVTGVKITALTRKNRIVPPDLECGIMMNYQTGISRFGGLFEMSLSMGVLVLKGRTYAWADDPEKSLGFKKNLIKDKGFWKILMEKLEKVLKEKVKYSEYRDEELEELLEESEAE
jgi:RecA/RadA recombinase